MTTPSSEYISVAGRAWDQRRPGVHWKVLREEGDRKTVLVRYDRGAVIAQILACGIPETDTILGHLRGERIAMGSLRPDFDVHQYEPPLEAKRA